MAAVTVRNLSDETHRALRLRAAANGLSTEAEIRAILDEAARPPARRLLGTELTQLAHKLGAVDLDITRDTCPASGPCFE